MTQPYIGPYPATMPVIGIFDSGVGGLTVTQSIRQHLPYVPVIYFADTARFPYGDKKQETIIQYAIENTLFLIRKGASHIVVACNTATCTALIALQKNFSIPIFGVIDPAVEHAARMTKNKKIGVIATTTTVWSQNYEHALQKSDPRIQVFSKACPLLAPLIEEENYCHDVLTKELISFYIRPLIEKNIDTLLLGCTHYPLLASYIQKEVGDHVSIIDPAISCGLAFTRFFLSMPHTVEKKITSPLLCKLHVDRPYLSCYVSGDIVSFYKRAKKILSRSAYAIHYE